MRAVNASTATAPTGEPRLNRATGYFTVALGRRTPGTTGNGRIYAHRWYMAQHIGRPLERGEVVHHRFSRDRNEPGDTLLFGSQGDHLVFHRLERTGQLLDREMAAVPLGARIPQP